MLRKTACDIGYVALRELDILRRNRIYGFCMIAFPLLLVAFFTTMLREGTPQDLPVGVVDQDNQYHVALACPQPRCHADVACGLSVC